MIQDSILVCSPDPRIPHTAAIEEAYDNNKDNEPSDNTEKDNEPSDNDNDKEPLDDDMSSTVNQFFDQSAMLLLGRMSPNGSRITPSKSIITPGKSKPIFRKRMRDKMKKDRENGINNKAAVVGSKVNVKIDKRDVTGAQGIHGIVFDEGSGGGIRVQTQHGTVTQKSGKNGTSQRLNMRF
jgi:hypothetical protein